MDNFETGSASRRILITGASGLLGLNLALELSPKYEVFGVVNTRRLNFAAWGESQSSLNSPGFKVIQADLLEPAAMKSVLVSVQPDWIIHCAALANLDACETFPHRAEILNAKLPGRLAEWTYQKRSRPDGLPRLLHISTDAVFDGQRGDYREEDEPNPLNQYARTKLAGEKLVLAADPEALIARVNLFGWSLRGDRSLGELFVYNLQAGKPMMGFVDVFFCPLLVNDLAGIFVQMLELRLKGLFHVVSSDSLSKYEFGLAIAQRFGLDTALISPTRVADSGLIAVRSHNLTLCTDKLTRVLGEPPPRFSPALHRFWELYQQGYPQRLRALLEDPVHDDSK